MSSSSIRNVLSAIILASAVGACSSAPDDHQEVAVARASVAEQLAAKGFEQDPARPVKQQRGVSVLFYAHPDGRAGALVRSDASGSERGVIYDPRTRAMLETLEPGLGGRAVTLRPRGDGGCSSSWTDWGPYYLTMIVHDSYCDGSTGSLCTTSIMWLTGDAADLGCQAVACSCVGGQDM